MVTPAITAEIVLSCATVELKVTVATPLAFVVMGNAEPKVLPVPVDDTVTATPEIGFEFASLAVTVKVVFPPSADIVPSDATRVDWTADTAPGFTVIVVVEVTGLAPMVA